MFLLLSQAPGHRARNLARVSFLYILFGRETS